MALLVFQCIEHLLRKGDTALSALFPYLGKCELAASVLTEFLHELVFRFGIRDEGIEGHDNRHIVLLHVFDVLLQVHDSSCKSL